MRKTGRKILSVLLTSAMMISVVGCGSNTEPAPTTAATGSTDTVGSPDATDVTSSKDTMILAANLQITTLDYLNGGGTEPNQIMFHYLGESLLNSFDDDGDGVTDLTTEDSITESYEWDADNLGVVYHLKQGIQMQDGTELQAEDVNFCIQRYSVSSDFDIINYAETKAQDDYTFYLKLNSYSQAMFNRVSSISIFSKEAYEACGNDGDFFTNQYISCGPYKLTDYVSGDSMTLTRFDDYFGNTPKIKTVIMRFIPESSVAMMELQTGGVDVVLWPAYTDYEKAVNNEYGENITADAANGMSTFLVGMNMGSDNMQSLLLRQAIMYAVNREEISNGTFNGDGKVCYRMLGMPFSNLTTYDEATWPYKTNIEKAKDLMKEAGLEDGITLTLITNNAGPNYQRIAEIMANQLKEIGVTVDINIYEPATFKANQNNLEGWDLSIASPGQSYISEPGTWFASGYATRSLHIEHTEGGVEAMALGEKLASSSDETEIETLTNELETKFYEEYVWWMPIQITGVYTIYNADIENMHRTQYSIDHVTDIYFK